MMRTLIARWNLFWFDPRPRAALTLPRVAICLVAALWFVSFWSSAPAWLAADGLLAQPLSKRMLATDQIAEWQVWSPLWFIQSPSLLYGWLAAGVVLCLVAASGLGGRLSLAALLLWVIAWANRVVVLSGLVEPTLVACLGYLVVEPGLPLWNRSPSASAKWTAGVARRLLQTHCWLLIAAGLLSQLGGLVWWRGEGVWWLAAAGRSNLFSIEQLRGHPLVVNSLSHTVIAVQILALWLLTLPAARPLGIVCGVLVVIVYGGVADHGLFAALLLAMLLSYCQLRERGNQEYNRAPMCNEA
ncbi:MAG: hypothetical protein KDA72_00725 [Planctomycetales bacterium]|nr:hypothetical protein [Planctomycetales bacterium]